MLKQELRFGNWVMNAHGRELQVTDMESTGKLSPIPLTEEWLVKLGCKKGLYFYLWDGAAWQLDQLSKNHWWLMYRGEDLGICIKYVNELQNLYFGLFKEELTIKP